MANVAHASLTGSELHEPKGAASAALGTVYVANGAGSGSWQSIGTSSFTGMIGDFPGPVAPAGWLELDGSIISTSTYSALFAVMSMTTSGTRSNGNPVITSIPSTANMVAGYYVFGTGINTGITILSVDSPTQITLSGNASSSGTAAFFVSPFLMNTGTIQLPDLTTAGRYRRSRSSTTRVGVTQSSDNVAHTHTLSVSGTTSTDPGHFHQALISDPGHTHSYQVWPQTTAITGASNFAVQTGTQPSVTGSSTTGVRITSSNGLDNTYSAGSHSHTVTSTGTSASSGGTETRPVTLVVLTCIKT